MNNNRNMNAYGDGGQNNNNKVNRDSEMAYGAQ
jgi:hypothetical protein